MPKGIPKSGVNKGWFKKGHKARLGMFMSKEQKRKMSESKRQYPFIVDYEGYYRCKEKDGSYVLYHRMVMEYYLRRKLASVEIVHHIDGNRQNNFIDNLKLMTISEHTKLHWEQGDIIGGGRK